MRALLALMLAACASSSESTAPPPAAPSCPVVGTYTQTGMIEPGGNCTPPATDGGTSGPSTTTLTISDRGGETVVEFQGVTGACALSPVEGCKYQGKCAFTVADALDPTNASGTVQYSWSFTAAGFSGITTLSVPPGKSLPTGCVATSDVTATRR